MACKQIILLIVLLLPLATSRVNKTNTSGSTQQVDTEYAIPKPEQQYYKAIEIRDNMDATNKELKHAVDLLYASANIEHLSIDTTNSSSSDGLITSSSVKLSFRNDTPGYLPALLELVFVFREGGGAPFNPAIAHRLLQVLAEFGDPEAQANLGFYLSLGIEPVAPNPRNLIFKLVPSDIPAALTHYYFSARGGDTFSQMALGYRHLHGLGVPKSCETAALYYEPAALSVIESAMIQEGLPDIRNYRLSHRTLHKRPRPNWEQELLHYQWFADFGHAEAARAVAHLLSHGAVGDFDTAVEYLQRAANVGDPDAMAHLGHLYANNIAQPSGDKNGTEEAWDYFWKAAEQGHPSGFFGLAYMHLTGEGAQQDYKRAFKYFKQAVDGGAHWDGQSDAFFYLGLMNLNGWGTTPDVNQAMQFFTISSKFGNVLAGYNLAVMHLRGLTGENSACYTAVKLLKRVAERGLTSFEEANEDLDDGDYEWALLNYLKSAEAGSELAESNAAWMLNEGYGYEGQGGEELAVALLQRAAGQGNAAALLRVGDSYWYGRGVERDWSRAAKLYTDAGRHRIAQALFNLGYMHQFGAGVPKDMYLAKRYYDRAGEAYSDAWLAVSLALVGLKMHVMWEKIQHQVPLALAAIVNRLLTVREEDGAVGRHQHRHASGPVGKILGLLNPFSWIDALEESDDASDISIVFALGLVLLLVLWRRQAVRNRQAQFFNQGFDIGGRGAAAAAAVPVQQQQQEQPEQQPEQQRRVLTPEENAQVDQSIRETIVRLVTPREHRVQEQVPAESDTEGDPLPEILEGLVAQARAEAAQRQNDDDAATTSAAPAAETEAAE